MVFEHYGLREAPFSITPDPRFVFLSERHRDALAHLLFGVGQGGGSGFVQLTGEVGTGKTTLSRLLLEQLPENTRVALILNPLLSPIELLQSICEELHVDLDGRHGNLKALVDALNAHLLEAYAAGLRVVLIIDEAQNLSTDALEQVRLLTNLETPTQKLLQIILLGQPELREKLARPELRQLAQRITARYHLEPLDADESAAYLRHRYAVAGGTRFPFTPAALRQLHRHAGGVPRLLNVIAERSLLAGYARNRQQIDELLLDESAAEVLPRRAASRLRMQPRWLAALAAGLLALTVVLVWHPWSRGVAAAGAARADDSVSAKQGNATEPTPAPPLFAQPTAAQKASLAAPTLDAGAFAQLLSGETDGGTTAWMAMLAHWNAPTAESDIQAAARCPLRLSSTLMCINGRAGISQLARFNRPVLLQLHAPDRRRRVLALLVGLGSRNARLLLAGGPVMVDRGTLESAYDGRYTALLGAPDFLSVPLRRGDLGASVDWLRQRLLAKATTDSGAPFDAALAAAVTTLQARSGLRSDGVFGGDTLLMLSADDAAGPHLQRLPD